MALASSLQPLWFGRGRLREGLTWFDTALTDLDAHHPLAAPAVRARALTACGLIAGQSYNAEAARAYLAEAIGLARELGDPWRLSQILASQAIAAMTAGDPIAARARRRRTRSRRRDRRPVPVAPVPLLPRTRTGIER